MPRACETCNHPKRLQIDRLLCQGRSKSQIAREFDVSTDSLSYHLANHVSRQMAQHMDRREAIDAVGLMDELQEIVTDTKAIFRRNFDAGKDITALKALDSRRATFDTILKACQLYHEAKLLELETSQEHLQTEQQARTKEGMSRLTFEELEVFLYLTNKMAGEVEGLDIPAMFKAPALILRQPLPPALPRPKTPCTTNSKPVYADEQPDPGLTPGPEPEPEIEPEKPKGLPPQHCTVLKEATREEQRRFINEMRGVKR